MSLYVGRLPPRVRPEELERVFQRFGRCNLQLKDGYAFIVYEVTANAERALRTLRGRIICGEKLFLNWSNRQPRPFERSVRGSRFYEPHRGRNFRAHDAESGFRDSQDRKDFVRARDPIRKRGEPLVDNVVDRETSNIHEDVDDNGREKDASNEGVVDESEINTVENDRWGGHASDDLSDHGQENDSDFGRYEPYHGYNRRYEREHNHRGTSYDSKDQVRSPEKRWREHSFDETGRNFDKERPERPCYNCGLVGHTVHNCPHADARRERFSKFNYRRDAVNSRVEDWEKVKRLRPNSSRRPNSGRDPLVRRQNWQHRMEYHSEKPRRVGRTETVLESGKKIRSKHRANSQAKGKRKSENGNSKKRLKKRKRTATSSDSSSTSLQSPNKSLDSSSATSSRLQSRSISSRSRSPSISSGSRSNSASANSKPATSRSMSKSRSRSSSRSNSLRSLSLSVSLDKKPLPSTQNIHAGVPMSMSPKANLEHVPTRESNHLSTNLETPHPIHSSKLNGENFLPLFKVDDETIDKRHGNGNKDAIYSSNNDGNGNNDATYSSNNDGDREYDPFTDIHKHSDKISENQGVMDITSENVGKTTQLQGHASAKLNMEVLPRCEGNYSTTISTQEMLLALKHYGLATPEGGESSISIEAYFGAARMWPWELIYYRRLRKGPISTENYARRLEQNREFGIVDRYIRSSSGWGECHQNDS